MPLVLFTVFFMAGLSVNNYNDGVQLQNLSEAKDYLVDTVKDTQGVQYDRLNG